MDCRTATKLVDDFREELLEPRAEADVRNHLAECRECRQAVRTMDILDERLRAVMAAAAPSETLTERIAAAVRRASPPAPPRRIEWLQPALLAAAACLLVSLGFWYFAAPRPAPPDTPQLAQVPPPPPAVVRPPAEPPSGNDYAIGEPFVIVRNGARPYRGPTHIQIARVVRGAPELIVEAFPEG